MTQLPQQTFSILYWINKKHKNSSGACPIYVRITEDFRGSKLSR